MISHVNIVSWEVVRNIANRLTNQLVQLGGTSVDINRAHLSCFSSGPERDFTLEEGCKGRWVQADGMEKNNGWMSFDEEDVSQLYWESVTSGSALEALKVTSGNWVLRYIPSPDMPEYLGLYFRFFDEPEAVENISIIP